MGQWYVCLGGAVVQGLPTTAYVRKDAQSDLLSALCFNPWYYTASATNDLQLLRVSWRSRGMLLFSVSVAMALAPLSHMNMTLRERTESAVCGLVVWDLWLLLAAKREADHGARAGSFSCAHVTVSNVQNVAVCALLLLLTKGDA